jgi:hypothetical protein
MNLELKGARIAELAGSGLGKHVRGGNEHEIVFAFWIAAV